MAEAVSIFPPTFKLHSTTSTSAPYRAEATTRLSINPSIPASLLLQRYTPTRTDHPFSTTTTPALGLLVSFRHSSSGSPLSLPRLARVPTLPLGRNRYSGSVSQSSPDPRNDQKVFRGSEGPLKAAMETLEVSVMQERR